MIVICEICGHKLGKTTRDRLKLPLTADMFDPPEPGYPPPFLDGADWVWMRCPMCNKRPFIAEDAVLTDEGVVQLGNSVNAEIERLHAEGLAPGVIGGMLGMSHQAVTKRIKAMEANHDTLDAHQ